MNFHAHSLISLFFFFFVFFFFFFFFAFHFPLSSPLYIRLFFFYCTYFLWCVLSIIIIIVTYYCELEKGGSVEPSEPPLDRPLQVSRSERIPTTTVYAQHRHNVGQTELNRLRVRTVIPRGYMQKRPAAPSCNAHAGVSRNMASLTVSPRRAWRNTVVTYSV